MSAGATTAFRDLPLDTSPDARALQDELYRRMSGRERAAIAFRLTALTRETTRAGIRRRHPEYDEQQVQLALARLILGDALATAVWPAATLVDP